MFDDDAVDTAEQGDANFDTDFGGGDELPSSSRESDGSYADEVFSTKVATRFRVFYIDLKESSNGKFVKISEKSRGGKRSTIMFDGEDLDAMIEALQELKNKM